MCAKRCGEALASGAPESVRKRTESTIDDCPIELRAKPSCSSEAAVGEAPSTAPAMRSRERFWTMRVWKGGVRKPEREKGELLTKTGANSVARGNEFSRMR